MTPPKEEPRPRREPESGENVQAAKPDGGETATAEAGKQVATRMLRA